MKKVIIWIFIMMFVVSPQLSHADNEFLARVQDKFDTGMYEAGEILEKYNLIQSELQEITSARDVVDKLKEEVKKEATSLLLEQAKGIKVSDLSPKGISEKLKTGDIVNVNLTKTIGAKYTARKMQNDDVKKIKEHQYEMQKMMAENMANMYARAITRRVKLMEEFKKLENENSKISGAGDNKDADGATKTRSAAAQTQSSADGNSAQTGSEDARLSAVINAYKESMMEANRRWDSMTVAQAADNKLLAEAMVSEIRLSSDNDDAQEEKKEDEKSKKEKVESNEPNALDLYNDIKNTKDNFSNGFFNGLRNISKQQTGGVNLIGDGFNIYDNADSVIKSGSSGDFGSALQNLATGTKQLDNNSVIAIISEPKENAKESGEQKAPSGK